MHACKGVALRPHFDGGIGRHFLARRVLPGLPGDNALSPEIPTGGTFMKKAALLALLTVAWTAWSAQACTTNAECDDANVCNGAETCQAGVCIPGLGITCNDGNACTLDSCDS